MKSNSQRRDFIRSVLSGMLLPGISSSVLSGFLASCHSIHHLETFNSDEDLKQLSKLINDKTTGLKWLFTGDSITQGAKHTYGFRSYPEIFSERVRFEMNRPRDVIINNAISGQVTQNILDDFEWSIQQFTPAVVSIMIGTNDAAISRKILIPTFENSLRMLITKFRKIHSIPILHTPNIIMTDKNPGGNERSRLPLYVDIIRKVAKEMNVLLVDHWSYWEINREKVFTEKWLADPLHPSARGQLEMARLFFRTISIWDDQSFTCSGHINF